MKRTTKPPQPPQLASKTISTGKLAAIPAPPSSGRRTGNTRPPPLANAGARPQPPPIPPPLPTDEEPKTVELPEHILAAERERFLRSGGFDDPMGAPGEERAPAPTLPFVPTPAVEWDPVEPPVVSQPAHHHFPSSGQTPAAPSRAYQEHERPQGEEPVWPSLDALGPPPSRRSLEGPAAPPLSSGSLPHAQKAPVSSGAYPAAMGTPDPSPSTNNPAPGDVVLLPQPAPAPVPQDGVPIGYIVVSAFFLAIAVVGFGLYLAFEVISL